MNEQALLPRAAETPEDKRAISRLLVFFALVYVVEGLGQIVGLILVVVVVTEAIAP